MGSIFKTIIGLLAVVIIAAYVLDSKPVSNTLQTGQLEPDPLVTGARVVKQELRVLTDAAHRQVYNQVIKDGLKKAADGIDKFVDSQEQAPKDLPQSNTPNI